MWIPVLLQLCSNPWKFVPVNAKACAGRRSNLWSTVGNPPCQLLLLRFKGSGGKSHVHLGSGSLFDGNMVQLFWNLTAVRKNAKACCYCILISKPCGSLFFRDFVQFLFALFKTRSQNAKACCCCIIIKTMSVASCSVPSRLRVYMHGFIVCWLDRVVTTSVRM